MYKLKKLTVKIKPFAKHELRFVLLKIVLKTLRTIFFYHKWIFVCDNFERKEYR